MGASPWRIVKKSLCRRRGELSHVILAWYLQQNTRNLVTAALVSSIACPTSRCYLRRSQGLLKLSSQALFRSWVGDFVFTFKPSTCMFTPRNACRMFHNCQVNLFKSALGEESIVSFLLMWSRVFHLPVQEGQERLLHQFIAVNPLLSICPWHFAFPCCE